MTAPGRHAAGDGSFARSTGTAAVRGAILIGLAVVIGLVLLAEGLDTGEVSIPGTTEDTTDTDATDTTTGVGGDDGGGDQTTVVPAAPARPPAEVQVLVANGSGGVQGAAGRARDQLVAQGYNALSPVNAPTVPTTTVYFAEGFQAEADGVAAVTGAPAEGVAPMPDPPPVELGGANVLVVLGEDVGTG